VEGPGAGKKWDEVDRKYLKWKKLETSMNKINKKSF
jgi:hypothetical protein